jgi:hypothetical protein
MADEPKPDAKSKDRKFTYTRPGQASISPPPKKKAAPKSPGKPKK